MNNEEFDMSNIDINKPIIAKDGSEYKYILLPQIEENSYKIIGYNWFDLKAMDYNSCCLFSTIESAIKAYSSYNISNCEIELK